MSMSLFTGRAAAAIAGMVAGGLLGQSADVRKGVRELVKKTIKVGLGRDAQTVFERVREDLTDLTAEAQAEMDAEKPAAAEHEHDGHACDGHNHGHSHAGEGPKG